MPGGSPQITLEFGRFVQISVKLGGNHSVLNQEIERDDLKRVLVRGFEDDRAAGASLLDFQPASSTDAPAIARLQAGEAVLRHRGGEIIAECFGRGQEWGVDDAADRVDAEVFRPGLAAAGAIKASHRVAAAGREGLAENVLAAVRIWIWGGHK